MELDITNTVDNVLLGRKEIKATLKYTGTTPSNAQVQEAIAAKVNGSKEQTVVKSIYTAFGGNRAKVTAFVYESAEAQKVVEPPVKTKKK
ncbi:hypothetical protein GF342_02695 [Candidatus Woesearchaeota archaeon]|nr:hypothetical protein [Candidatus Woesearchaeota archaeon]